MKNKPEIFKELERLSAFMPAALYWTDTNAIVVGINKKALEVMGDFATPEDVIGKSLYELYPLDATEAVEKNIKEVIQTGKVFSFEKSVIDTKLGKHYTITRAPLFDAGKIVGVMVIMVDITDIKEREGSESQKAMLQLKDQLRFKKLVDQAAYDVKSPLAILLILVHHCSGLAKNVVFEMLETLADVTPIPLYWFDENNVLLSSNKWDAESVGGTFVGKTPYDYYPFEIANNLVKNNHFVMQSGKILSYEEQIRDVTTGEIKYFTAFKAPLYDNYGKTIGILGTSIDNSMEKHAERLKLENELQKVKIQEQERYGTLVNQLAHDIRSPVASLSMIVDASKNLPEKERIILNNVAKRITDIANNLLGSYKKADAEIITELKEPQPVLISLALSRIVSEKRKQYLNYPSVIKDFYEPNCNFLFIKTDPSNFDRMISNLVNNAFEAFEGRKGKVDLTLARENECLKVTVKDNGKGMSQEILDKIMNNVVVTVGKKNGSGIGFTQIRGTLQISKGKMLIESTIGKGTTVTLTFPVVDAPDWLAKQIVLHQDNTVVILDDDQSIHGAWDMRFKDYEKVVHLKHFKSGKKAIDFINSFAEKNKIFLLADFELLGQELNGLQVIEQASMTQQAILVTSHYNKQDVLDVAANARIKILPKQLASTVPINIEEKKEGNKDAGDRCKKVNLVVIDDVQIFADSLAGFFESQSLVVDTYYNPTPFLQNLSKYAKDTKICMDNDFHHNISGIDLAKKLYAAGYTRLYLLSGKDFREGEVPSYLTVIMKGDMDALNKLV